MLFYKFILIRIFKILYDIVGTNVYNMTRGETNARETHRTCGENKTKNNGRDGSLYFVLTRNGM